MDDKYEHVLALNRARQARWREQNKEQIAEKRRADRSELITTQKDVFEISQAIVIYLSGGIKHYNTTFL